MELKIIDFAPKFNNLYRELEVYLPKDKYTFPLGLNHPNVKNVIRIALELSKENKVITTELLYNLAKKTLKIPGGGLKKIIQILLNRKIIVDGSRFTKINILKNKTRSFIYQLIKANPGIHFSFLKTKVSQLQNSEMGVGHLIWHLEKLISFNLVKKVKVKNYTLFLPVEVSDEEGILYFVLRDDLNRLIIMYLLKNESVNKADLYKELNVKRERIYYRIKTLNELGIISLLTDDGKRISIDPNKRDLIKRIMTNYLSS